MAPPDARRQRTTVDAMLDARWRPGLSSNKRTRYVGEARVSGGDGGPEVKQGDTAGGGRRAEAGDVPAAALAQAWTAPPPELYTRSTSLGFE
eukprot:2133534-Prymnesium_polylepis.1